MIYEPILFPDVESLLVDELDGLLDAPVVMTVPPDHPVTDELVGVTRAGGPGHDLVVDDATIVLEARSPDRRQALALLQQARAYVGSMVGTTLRAYRESSGPAFLPDPDTKQPRYQMTVVVTVRGYPAS